MKVVIKLTLAVVMILALNIPAQELDIQNVIGKAQSEVVKKFGAPVHKDNSNPEMVCMFYKSANRNMVFVSDLEGVYQAEATVIFENESDARNKVDELISNSMKNEFAADTISIMDFHLHKTGVKADLQLVENKISKKYEIRIKANRTED